MPIIDSVWGWLKARFKEVSSHYSVIWGGLAAGLSAANAVKPDLAIAMGVVAFLQFVTPEWDKQP